MSELFRAIEMSQMAKAILRPGWLWPAVESAHVAALVVLVASITAFDLRLIGVGFKNLRVSDLGNRLLPSTWSAFAIMILSGAILFIPSAERKYLHNPAFQLKMLLILLAGINMSIFHFTVYRDVGKWDESSSTPAMAKIVGSVSVLLWAAVVVAGRFIGFA